MTKAMQNDKSALNMTGVVSLYGCLDGEQSDEKMIKFIKI